MITVTAPNNKSNEAIINKRILAINEAVKRAVPLSAKAIADVIKKSDQIKLDTLIGTKNKSGKSNSKPHIKMRDTLQVLKFSDSPFMSRYDIAIGAPYWNWIENGSNAAFGLPWSNAGGRNFSKSAFKGYQAIKKGFDEIVKQNTHIQIIQSIISKEIMKVK